MGLALRELIRKPTRFLVAGGMLTLLVVLLLFLGGLLDGLFLGSTGAIRSQDADVVVYSADARESFLRSTVTAEQRAEIDALAEVADSGGLGFSLFGISIPGEDELADAAVVGYDRSTGTLPEPPAPGEAYADRRLEADGVELGDMVLVGAAEVPVTVVGWVSDTNYLLQGGLWVEPGTWREIQNASRPDAIVADGEFQALVLDAAPGVGTEELIVAVDRATGGATESLSQNDAVFSLPGISEQNATFNAVIGVTLFVAALVVALFFALLILERLDVYSLLKAIGSSNARLVVGVFTQATLIAISAFVVGGLLVLGLSRVVPEEVPVQFEVSRAIFVLVAIVVTAVVGSAVSLRRIVRIDPAANLGSGT